MRPCINSDRLGVSVGKPAASICCAPAPGTTMRRTCAPRTATRTIRATATASSISAVPEFRSRGPRFVAEPQLPPSSLKALDHLAQHIGAIGESAQLPDPSRTASIGHRNSNRRLVNIQSNVANRMHLTHVPCIRLCAGSPAQPSFLACRETVRFTVPREHTVSLTVGSLG